MIELLILYSRADFDQALPFPREQQRLDAEYFSAFAAKQGVRISRTSIDSYDAAKQHFTRRWIWKNGRWEQKHEPYRPDSIWDRAWEEFHLGDFDRFMAITVIAQDQRMFNQPQFNLLFRNKLTHPQIFPDLLPSSLAFQSVNDLPEILARIPGDRVVVKPAYGSGGRGVYIGSKDEEMIRRHCAASEAGSAFLAQEFIASLNENGCVRDYRLVYSTLDGLVYGISRLSSPGSAFTNVSKGGEKQALNLDLLPSELLSRANDAARRVQTWSRAFFSLDFLLGDDGKPYLIEINTIPGFSKYASHPEEAACYINAILTLARAS
jgi:glutathione synthase/RimK-type ligase-like ATP-grasp enzyme